MLDDHIYREMVEILDRGQSAVLATIVAKEGASPREVGSKLLLREDGSFTGSVGGGLLEAQVLEEARQVLAQGEPRLARFGEGDEAATCGGVLDVYLEPISGSPTLYVFGAGHVGYYICKVGHMAGFRVVVVDEREPLANRERFPEAEAVIAQPWAEALDRLHVTPSSYIVIVRGHDEDGGILEWAIKTPARYLGMIGSRSKIEGIYAHLRAGGLSERELERVHAPVGMDIGAETPQEIAVAVLAEMIKVRRGKE